MHRIDHGRAIVAEIHGQNAYTRYTGTHATIAILALILSAVQF